MKNNFFDTLCMNHNHIRFNLMQIRKKIKKEYLNEEILDLINNTLECISVAKRQGQHMENRLKKYRNAIESCGFKRISKNKGV